MSSSSLMQLIRACWCAAEKPGGNASRPSGAWPGLRSTTSSAIKPSKQTTSPALTASIQVECSSRIARSSGLICNVLAPNVVLQARPQAGVACKHWLGHRSSVPFLPRAPTEARHSIDCRPEKAEGRELSALIAPSERSRLFQADAFRERISVPMHEPPVGPFTAKDLCDTQRPVLLW